MRWFHWINVPILGVMLWSGYLIYSMVNVPWLGGFLLVPLLFIPYLGQGNERFFDGLALHYTFMWLFLANGLAYVVFMLVSGGWRDIVPDRQGVKDAVLVVLNDLRITRRRPFQRQYNAAQRFAYTCILAMGAGSVVTGLALYKPIQLRWLVAALGGYDAVMLEHFFLAIGYVVFIVIHLLQVIRAGWNVFRSMITGSLIRDTALEHARHAESLDVESRQVESHHVR
jgi:thiosulfate reductase cytochrome b subunit